MTASLVVTRPTSCGRWFVRCIPDKRVSVVSHTMQSDLRAAGVSSCPGLACQNCNPECNPEHRNHSTASKQVSPCSAFPRVRGSL